MNKVGTLHGRCGFRCQKHNRHRTSHGLRGHTQQSQDTGAGSLQSPHEVRFLPGAEGVAAQLRFQHRSLGGEGHSNPGGTSSADPPSPSAVSGQNWSIPPGLTSFEHILRLCSQERANRASCSPMPTPYREWGGGKGRARNTFCGSSYLPPLHFFFACTALTCNAPKTTKSPWMFSPRLVRHNTSPPK